MDEKLANLSEDEYFSEEERQSKRTAKIPEEEEPEEELSEPKGIFIISPLILQFRILKTRRFIICTFNFPDRPQLGLRMPEGLSI